jgi:23S rRNA pseudouridine2605 synthase
LWESQGVTVSRLKRVRYGNIFIPSHVRVGQWVELTDTEIAELCGTAGVNAPSVQPLTRAQIEIRERHQRKLRSNKQTTSYRKKNKR